MTAGGSDRVRLDQHLVALGVFDSRAQAQAAIAAGRVTVDGVVAGKASVRVPADAQIHAEPAHPYVSRAALKLAHALEVFHVDPAGKTCLDIGASTGGFAQVLLQAGAERVYAVDVGRGQLHASVRANARVVDLSPLDARALTVAHVAEPPSLIVCDASFIGLRKVIARPLSLAAHGAELVALFKPQFEVGPDHIGKGGLVRPDAPVTERLDETKAALAAWGWPVSAQTDSPIAGGDGNREILLHAQRRDV